MAPDLEDVCDWPRSASLPSPPEKKVLIPCARFSGDFLCSSLAISRRPRRKVGSAKYIILPEGRGGRGKEWLCHFFYGTGGKNSSSLAINFTPSWAFIWKYGVRVRGASFSYEKGSNYSPNKRQFSSSRFVHCSSDGEKFMAFERHSYQVKMWDIQMSCRRDICHMLFWRKPSCNAWDDVICVIKSIFKILVMALCLTHSNRPPLAPHFHGREA